MSSEKKKKYKKFTQEEKLKLYDDFFFALGYAQMGFQQERIEELLTFIRFGYCYRLMNSSEGDSRSFEQKMNDNFIHMKKVLARKEDTINDESGDK